MKGKDIFLGLEYIGEDLIQQAECGTFPEKAKKRYAYRRPLQLAAMIALLLMLVGCAVVYVLRMQNMDIGSQQTYQDSFAYDPDTGEAVAYLGRESVQEQVLTIAGLKGSPNYRAAQEWFAYKQAYDPDHAIAIRAIEEGLVPEFPPEYGAYNLYTQEMKDKLDEILSKYGLKLIGREVPFRTEELVCKALGLEDILVSGSDASMELNYASYYECGNLHLSFYALLPAAEGAGPLKTSCNISYLHKEAFSEDALALAEIETWKEWNYTTASGADVLIFRSPTDWRGYIFCDMPNYTVTLQFTFIHELYSNDAAGNTTVDREIMTDRQIEQLADTVDFSIEPRLTEGWEDLTAQAAGSGETVGGYTIALKAVESDGNNALITLSVTAPEGVDLQTYGGCPVMLQPGNRWGFFEQTTEGSSNVSGGYYTEEDGDGKANTRNVVLRYTAGTDQLREGERPFASGKVWSIYWQDLYAHYLNPQTNEPESVLLAEGTWSIEVVFADVITEELELIRDPVPARAAYGWDLQGNDVYQDTRITSFLLRPMSASIICDLEDMAPDFLTVGDRCVYAVMHDGSRVAFYSDSAGSGIQNLFTETPIDLSQVSYVLLPDGTKLTVTEG